MSRHREAIFAIVLGLLLAGTVVFLGAQSPAAAVPGEPRVMQAEPTVTEEAPVTPQAARVRELVNLRADKSKTFELADGQHEWVGYSEPVHYKDASGAFQEIDNTIVSDSRQLDGVDYAYRNAANAYTVRFAAKGDPSRLVSIESEGKSIAFGLLEARSSDVVKTANQASKALSEETYSESVVSYIDVLPGIDLVYQPRSSGVKEYIVLRQPGPQSEFTFNLVLNGLSVKQADGQVSFVDEEGKTVFVLGSLVAFDDAEAWTSEVTYRIEESGGTCQLTVIIPRAYLDDPARVYPVVIDPTIDLWTPSADTFISSANASTNYSSSSGLRTGRDTPYGIRRSFLKYDDVNSLSIDGDDVTSAYLRIEKLPSGGGVTPAINAWWSLDSFTCTTMTWSSGTPHWDGSSSDRYGSPASTTATADGGNWYRMYVTTPVQYWLNGTYPNCGWMIKDTRETNTSIWTTFYASNAGSPHRPELHIVYTSGSSSWTYCYDHYTSGYWVGSQNPTDSARVWFANDDQYFRLDTSTLGSYFPAAIRAAAATWSSISGCTFDFAEWSMGSDFEDHVLSVATIDLGLVACLYGSSQWLGGGQADVGNWHIKFNSMHVFTNGAASGAYDRQGVATHELGHAIRLLDLSGTWSDSDSNKPTMAGWGTNTTGWRSLAPGDIAGVNGLY